MSASLPAADLIIWRTPMRDDAEVTSVCAGRVSDDASFDKQVASLGLESFEVVW